MKVTNNSPALQGVRSKGRAVYIPPDETRDVDLEGVELDTAKRLPFLKIEGVSSPVVTGTSTVKREKIGQLEVEYSTSSSTDIDDLVALATPVVTTIEGALWPFLTPVWPGALVV
nr:hypothetical protein [Ensifer aridi]